MLINLTQAYITLILFQTLHVMIRACPKGWFGPNCTFMCHCSGSNTCDSSGICPTNSQCSVGYFGPGCQYVDGVRSEALSSVPLYLRDSNDATCNSNKKSTSVKLSFGSHVPVSWIRIIVEDGSQTEETLNFVTSYDNNTTCWIERKFFVDNITIEVKCELLIVTKEIQIDGNIAANICSIFISSGMNVALKQETRQSSNLSDDIGLCGSANAVDGNSNWNLDGRRCACTSGERDGPEWHLKFRHPVRIFSISIYNRNIVQYRLKGFQMSLYTANGDVHMMLTSDLILAKYTLPIHSVARIDRMRIKKWTDFEYVSDKVLTLCEVEVFADNACPDNRYGLFCDAICQCKETEACDTVTGLCLPGCSPGSYGFNCSFQCGEKCLFSVCHYYTGMCLQCFPGYIGPFCNTTCPPGTFGSGCMLKCSIGCANTCNNINGICTCKNNFVGLLCVNCKPGVYGYKCQTRCSIGCSNTCNTTNGYCTCKERFAGLLCAECYPYHFGSHCDQTCSRGCSYNCNITNAAKCFSCSQGWYGVYCDKSCSEFCYRKWCNMSDGECFECFGNRIGPTCEDCESNYYGIRCEYQCPVDCVNESCDDVSGKCSVCKTGYTGEMCLRTPEKTVAWIAPMLFLPCLFLLFVCIADRRYDDSYEDGIDIVIYDDPYNFNNNLIYTD